MLQILTLIISTASAMQSDTTPLSTSPTLIILPKICSQAYHAMNITSAKAPHPKTMTIVKTLQIFCTNLPLYESEFLVEKYALATKADINELSQEVKTSEMLVQRARAYLSSLCQKCTTPYLYSYISYLNKGEESDDDKYFIVLRDHNIIGKDEDRHLVGLRQNKLELLKAYEVQVDVSQIPDEIFEVARVGTSWFESTAESQAEQGWKIHISAMPHSAYKIAAIVLPILKNHDVSFKIMKTVGILRTFNFILPLNKTLSTQAGKFIAIYPSNIIQAYQLASEIDFAFQNAFNKGILEFRDFYSLTGDAHVGSSGGIYARYGAYSSFEVKEITPLDKSIKVDNQRLLTVDNRSFPWPDFMNGDLIWRTTGSPFGKLEFFWINPYTGDQITWYNRPYSWSDLDKGNLELVDRVRRESKADLPLKHQADSEIKELDLASHS